MFNYENGTPKSLRDLLSFVTKLLQHSCQENNAALLSRDHSTLSRDRSTPVKKSQPPVKRSQHSCKHCQEKMIEYLNFFLLCTLVTLLCYMYVRIKRYLTLLKMAEDIIISGLPYDAPQLDAKRQKLLECVLTGKNSKLYLKRVYTEDQMKKLSDEEVNKLFSNHKAKLSGQMTKSLGKSIINMHSMGACATLGISNQDSLCEDLKSDPFLSSALKRFTCELYYRFSSFLAPVGVRLIMSRHYLSEKNKNGEQE